MKKDMKAVKVENRPWSSSAGTPQHFEVHSNFGLMSPPNAARSWLIEHQTWMGEWTFRDCVEFERLVICWGPYLVCSDSSKAVRYFAA
jgi:hypothetical protein